jgi:hypothetical protein
MLRPYAAERTIQSKLFYRGYDLELRRAPSGWQVGIYPRRADLPILGRNEIFARDPDEAVVMAKGRVDGATSSPEVPSFINLSVARATGTNKQ